MFRTRHKKSPSYKVIKNGVGNLGREVAVIGWMITNAGKWDVELI